MLHHLFSHCPVSDLDLPLDRHGVGGEFRVLPGDLGGLLSSPLEMLNQRRLMPFLAALATMITAANVQTPAYSNSHSGADNSPVSNEGLEHLTARLA